MIFSEDMRELLEIFESREVRYLVVGGFAVNFYGYVRNTQDLDILVFPSAENARRVVGALEEFGFGDAGIPRSFFQKEGAAIHLGVEPNRIDLLTNLEGLNLDRVFERRERVTFEGQEVAMIAYEDLLEAKRKSSRPKDHADVHELESTERKM